MRRTRSLLVVALFAGLPARGAVAADAPPPAVKRAVEYLRAQVPKMSPGEAADAADAMFKAGVPGNDPGIVACFARFGAGFNGTSYSPEAKGGPEIRDASGAIAAMVGIDRVGYKPYIEAACEYILARQMPNGAWDLSNRTMGDVSITQYALLGLWEGQNAGFNVPAKVWDDAAKWVISVQSSQGSWNAHRDDATSPETVAMTGNGVVSLLLCRRQLSRDGMGQEPPSPLMSLAVVGAANEGGYKAQTSGEAIDKAARSGIKWMNDKFRMSNAPIVGPSLFECLCTMERVTALAEASRLAVPADWYKRGVAYVNGNQRASGAWDAGVRKEIYDTCAATLFVLKGTADTIRREEILHLSAGRPKTGRGSASDIADVEVVQGRLVAKPMSGDVAGMIAALEEGGAKVDAARSGLAEAYRKDGPKALVAYKEKLRVLARGASPDREPPRSALGRTGELDVAPLLIKSLSDPNEGVANEAKLGLQMLAQVRRVGSCPRILSRAREAAVLGWRQWFESVRPPELDFPRLIGNYALEA